MTAFGFPLNLHAPTEPARLPPSERDRRLHAVCREMYRIKVRAVCTGCGKRWFLRGLDGGHWYPSDGQGRVDDWAVRCDCGRPLPAPRP